MTKRCCISGSPPLIVRPPDMIFRPDLYFRSSSLAFATVTGMPVVIVHVFGVWGVEAPPHAPGRPCDDAYAGTVNGRSRRERVKKSHVASGERRPDIRF